jgi:hypothetical protein
VQLTEPPTKLGLWVVLQHPQHIGCFASEEDAARAYDCAAVQAHGPGTKRNFPDEVPDEQHTCKLPVAVGEERTQRSRGTTSDPPVTVGAERTQRSRETINELPVSRGEERTQRSRETISDTPAAVGEERKLKKSSRYVGVSWHKATSLCGRTRGRVRLWDPQTKSERQIGRYACEEDAARAYDDAAVQAHGPGARRNFPGEDISELPVSRGEEGTQRSCSHLIGHGFTQLRARCINVLAAKYMTVPQATNRIPGVPAFE